MVYIYQHYILAIMQVAPYRTRRPKNLDATCSLNLHQKPTAAKRDKVQGAFRFGTTMAEPQQLAEQKTCAMFPNSLTPSEQSKGQQQGLHPQSMVDSLKNYQTKIGPHKKSPSKKKTTHAGLCFAP